jgi:hypothetical protein
MGTFEKVSHLESSKKEDTGSKVNSKLYLNNYGSQPSELQALSPSFHQQSCTGTEHQD